MKDKRYLPNVPFPAYAFLPGKFPHPHQEGGHAFGSDLKESSDQDLLFLAMDLFNFGYYWETHEALEILWNREGRKSPLAMLYQGLIKVSAGRLKEILGQAESALGHYKRARELLEQPAVLTVSPIDLSDLLAGFHKLERQGELDLVLTEKFKLKLI